MIILFTDFGLEGPYVGQLKATVYNICPQATIVDLMHDAPMFDVKHSALLLNSLSHYFPSGCIFCCVVDPGVGSNRNAIVVKADDNYFVGPDNGLFEYILQTRERLTTYKIAWTPESLSSTFHGRDIFAPIAAQIESGQFGNLKEINPTDIKRFSWPNDVYEIIYIDHFGNLMTGIKGSSISTKSLFNLKGKKIAYAQTYADMRDDELSWYINSNNLVEIGVNQSDASIRCNAHIGDPVDIFGSQ